MIGCKLKGGLGSREMMALWPAGIICTFPPQWLPVVTVLSPHPRCPLAHRSTHSHISHSSFSKHPAQPITLSSLLPFPSRQAEQPLLPTASPTSIAQHWAAKLKESPLDQVRALHQERLVFHPPDNGYRCYTDATFDFCQKAKRV